MKSFFFKELGGQWLATLWVAVLTTYLTVFLGRYMGPAAYGVYSYVHGLAFLYLIIQDGGFRLLLFREAAGAAPAAMPLTELIARGEGHLLLTTGVAIVLIFLLPIAEKAALVAALLCTMGVWAAGMVSMRLKGEGKFLAEAGWRVWQRSITFIFMVAGVLLLGAGSARVFAFWLLGLLVVLGVKPKARAIFVRPRFSWDWNLYRSVLYLLLIDAATILYFRMDLVLLRTLSIAPAEIGQYAAAYRVLDAGLLGMTPVAHMAFRHLRRRFVSEGGYPAIMWWLIAAAFGAGLLCALGGQLVGHSLLRLLFGEKFLPAAEFFVLLVYALVFILPNFILTQALLAYNREKFYAFCALGGVLVNLMLNLWLIPSRGAMGAGAATIATEAYLFVVLLAGLWLSRRRSEAG